MEVGDRVVIVDELHPWFAHAGVILEWGQPDPWTNHRGVVELDDPPGHRAACAELDIRVVSDLA